MQRNSIFAIASLFLLSVGAQAQEVDGLWVFPTEPDYNMTVVDGPANAPDEALGVSILGPDFTDWGIFYGINEGDAQNVSANLIPSITNSDMRARWISSGLTGTLQIQSCTRNCPFAAGQTLQITKIYGDGVYPEEPAPQPGEGVTPGEWGNGVTVCLNVAADGRSLTRQNSPCPEGASVWMDRTGLGVDVNGQVQLDLCVVQTWCLSDVSINGDDGSFQCTTDRGLIEGWFRSDNAADGFGYTNNGGIVCGADWEAEPR